MNRLKYFFFSGMLLTAVTITLRAVSVAFNVYLSNKIGAVAMGVFGLISTVYNFGLTLATSGISLATTRLISESMSKSGRDRFTVRTVMRQSINYALFFGVLSFVLLFVLAEPIGVKALGDIRTVRPLKVLSITFPFVSLSSALSGYFVAKRTVYKNALVSILGQVARIYFCIAFFAVLGANDVESACLSIVLGGTLSEIISLLIQFCLYAFDKRNKDNNDVNNKKKIRRKIYGITLPVAFSAYIRSGLITLEHLLIPWGLKKNGSSQDASLAAYGTVQSMVFPLVLFPSAISSSFAGLLIPEIAEANADNDKNRIVRVAEKVFKSVLIFSIGTAGIMMCLSLELGHSFYPDTEAGKYILMVAPLVPVMYLDTSVDSMLKGLGKQTYTMLINVIDAFLSVILVVILLPKFGIIGFIITVYFTEIINATLSVTYLLKVCDVKIRLFEWIVKPLVCVFVATTIIRYSFSKFSIFAQSKIEAIIHIFIGACVYLLLLVIVKAIDIKSITKTLQRLK